MKNSQATRVRKARLHSKLSQSDLANLVGVHRSAVSQWETLGGSTPTADNLARIAVATAVQFEWLATGRGRMEFASGIGEPEDQIAVLNYSAHNETEARALVALRLFKHTDLVAIVEMLEALGGTRSVKLTRSIPISR